MAAETRFTPGPFHWFEHEGHPGLDRFSLCSQDGPCEESCPAFPHCHTCVIYEAVGVEKANRALLAAAPGLYDFTRCLTLMLGHVLGYANGVCGISDEEKAAANALIANATALLSIARGEEQNP